ncbi:MAG: type IV pilus assembly protein PilM [Candidatus Buchananbacteria bacterium]|nr:type IV pilus assembly protein PilM [Candidatus Buchananbacteria bacterium]
MSFFNTTEVAFGLDISDRNLRMVQLERSSKKAKVQIYNEIKLPPDCISSGEIKQPKVFLDALSKMIKTKIGHGKLSDEVISVLPEEKTFFKILNMPLIPDEEIVAKIKEILPQDIPVNFDDIYMDHQIIEKNDQGLMILVGVSPKNIIESYVDILAKANLIPTVLEIESAPISRLLLEEANDQKPQIIIDIGAQRTGLFLYDKTIKFTVSLPISGNNITRHIVDTLEMKWDEAEKAKIVCGLDKTKCHGALLEIFSDVINELSDRITKAINFYYYNFPEAKNIERILLCGGGSNFIDIASVLQEKLKIPVIISNPWQVIANPDKSFFNSQRSQSFVTALGLALRGLKPETFL